MSLCEFRPSYQKQVRRIYSSPKTSRYDLHSGFSNINQTRSSKTSPNLNRELEWGISYRSIKQAKDNLKSLLPKKDVVNRSFKGCSERQRKKEFESDKNKQKVVKKKHPPVKKLSLLEKSILPQNKYMEYLSMPNFKKFEEPSPKKKNENCRYETCSPRLLQLSIPNKRRVYANWKEYHNQLPTEVLLRYEQILYSKNVLKPEQAKRFYQQLDKQKKKQLKTTKRQKQKKHKELEKKLNKWLENEINQTVDVIVDFVQNEPVYLLNYRQLQLSDELLNQLVKKKVLKKPKRNCKETYRKTLIDISDKLALWMDTLLRFIDTQNVESDEDIPCFERSSCDDECTCSGWYREEDDDEDGECVTDTCTEAMLDKLDEDDLLNQLIRILTNCSDDFLDSKIEGNNLPGVCYRDITDVLIDLQYETGKEEGGYNFMEQLLLAWAIKNDPDKVDDKMHHKIKETAHFLGEYFRFIKSSGNCH